MAIFYSKIGRRKVIYFNILLNLEIITAVIKIKIFRNFFEATWIVF